jgi:RNA polymerase-binding transcription factor DksA
MAQYTYSHYHDLIMKIIEEQKMKANTIRHDFYTPLSESVGEISHYDQHSSDLANETLERSKDLGLLAQSEYILSMCEKALERMDEGTYGICRECNRSIDPQRLRAIPYVELCLDCQAVEEEQHPYHRPVEEEVLSPPFQARSGYGVYDDQIDRDDAWEIMAKHGNANSLQDANDSFDDDADGEKKGNG